MKRLKQLFSSFGPAIIVAAIVLGPGSILTSSKVGAQYGYPAVTAIILAVILMIAMVALSARIGVIYDDSPCDQLARRLGRPVSVIVGAILFALVAIFQYSNNVAIISGLAPLFDSEDFSLTAGATPAIILVSFNAVVIFCFYRMRHLYDSIESLMKWLIGLMVVAFLINFLVVFSSPRGYVPVSSKQEPDVIVLLGLMGTTFSVGGAFYQAYLVKEKGWKLPDAQRGLFDSVISISVVGVVSIVILMTAARVFHGRPDPVVLSGVGDVAMQLQPLFGRWAKVIFCLGIFAGAFSSFLVNALVGGTVLSDSLGKGSRLGEGWTLSLTTVALLCGLIVALFNLSDAASTVNLITFAQALTVLGLPALALALLYLGTRPDLTGERKVPRWIISLGWVGFIVALALAVRTSVAVLEKLGW
ncbi:divalent metal cation transporter [Akkermansiaceae bacterium]|nr:divalent metal cation transporter [Akkermansiaceae bacterium]|tara:strand:- start:18364 stop:19614 length:1251 start_codon:yes stop_codon:yes gene_type:complete